MKKRDLIIVIIFILFLTLPGTSYWFVKDKMNNENYEKRELYSKPDFAFSNILDFPTNYENYFNDHLAYKNEIRIMRAKLLYKMFNTSSVEEVIVGNDGWLFYNGAVNNDGDPISDYKNISRYTEDEKYSIAKSLLNTANYLNSRNVEFYILILPNKENVYSDKLERIIAKSDNQYSKTEDLITYLRNSTNLNIIYPKDILVNNRVVFDTYYKYDTHWNNYGAYLGVSELMKSIEKTYRPKDINVIGAETNSGDLANMNLITNVTNNEPLITDFYSNITYNCETGHEFYNCTSDNALYDKTILVVGDSFKNSTIQYLAKMYTHSIFVHRNYYNEDLIGKYNVDIVVYESVERYSNLLINTDILISQ